MAGTVKGMTIEIGGNTAPLEQALKDTNKEIKSTQNELKEVNKLLKLDPTNTDLVKQKQQLLAQQISQTTTKLDALKQAQKQLDEEMKKGGNVNQEEYRKLQRDIASAETSLKGLKKEATESNPQLSKLKEGLEKAGEAAKNGLKVGCDLVVKGIQAMSAAAVVAVTGLANLGLKAGQAADDLNTLASITGLSTEQLQKFQYASELIDVDVNTLAKALQKTTTAMSNASKGTGQSAEAFKKLGVNIKNADGTLRNNNVVFQESIKALGNIANETERDALAMELFGKSATELNPLIKGGIDQLNEMGQRAEKLGLILSQEAVDGANAFNDQIDILKSNSKGIFSKIGNQVARDLTPAMEQLNSAVESVIGRLSKAIDTGGIQGLIDEIIAMFSEINWTEVANTISEGLQSVLNYMNDFLSKIDWKKVGEDIINFVKSIDWKGLIEGVFTLIGNIIGGAGQLLWGAFGVLADDIDEWWQKKMEEAGGNSGEAFVNGTKEVIVNSGSTLYDALAQPLAQGITDALNIDYDIPNFHKLTQNLGIWWEDLKWKWQNNVLLPVQTWYFQMELDLRNFFNALGAKWDSFWNWITGIPNDIFNFGAGIGTSVRTWFTDLINDIGNFFSNLGSSITTFFTDTIPTKWEEFMEWLKTLPEKLGNIGKNLVEGLYNGMKNATGWLKDKLRDWANSIIDSLKSYLGIESPSKVMADEVGTYMAEGVGVGFSNTLPSVVKAMQEKLGQVAGAFQSELSFGDIPQVQGHTIHTENQYITKNFTNTVETIRQPQTIELTLDDTKIARALIPALDQEYNRLGVRI